MNAKFAARMVEVDNITAIKWTSSDYYEMIKLKDLTHGEMNVINGPDEMLLMGLSAGADGGIGTTYNFMPDLMVKIYSLAKEGKIDEARAVQSVANKAIAELLRYGAIPACKHLISLYGVPYGDCREPFMPLDDEAKESLLKNAWEVVEDFRKKQ